MSQRVDHSGDGKLIPASNLPHTLKSLLASAKYRSSTDLAGLSEDDLVLELNIDRDQALSILQWRDDSDGPTRLQAQLRHLDTPHTFDINVPPGLSLPASSLLASASTARIGTLSDPMDRLIGEFTEPRTSPRASRKGKERAGEYASIVSGTSLEISGPPGSGKTAFSIGVALSARLKRSTDPAGENADEPGEVLLVDTEGSIPPARLRRAAEAVLLNTEDSPRDVLLGIHLLRIPTQVQMIGLLNVLDDWLGQHPKVNLVVIDTLSYHFRQPSLDMKTRSRIMDLVKQQVGKATTLRKCAVVVTNQLATKLLTAENRPANFETGNRAVLMPQLGDSWTTAKTIRVVLFRGVDDLRYAHASSASSRKDIGWSRYDIDPDGLPCNPVESEQTSHHY